MRRASTIILGILLGALAAGLGIGFFLKKANDDRERLALEVEKTAQQAAQARAENTKAVEDANAKLQAANTEVAKAQQYIKSLQEERDLIASAETLLEPNSQTIRGWSDVVNVDLGFSIKLPPNTTVDANTAREFTVSRTPAGTDPRWFSITPYSQARETELRTALTTNEPISYLSNGRLLAGQLGKLPGSTDSVMVLRAQQSGTSTHLIWIRFPETKDTDLKTAQTVLSSLHFSK